MKCMDFLMRAELMCRCSHETGGGLFCASVQHHTATNLTGSNFIIMLAELVCFILTKYISLL